jgi:hypothetical protein
MEAGALIIYLLHDAVWGDDESDYGDYLAFEMLRTLDLVRRNEKLGEYIPTPDLLRIFQDAFFARWCETNKPTDLGSPVHF